MGEEGNCSDAFEVHGCQQSSCHWATRNSSSQLLARGQGRHQKWKEETFVHVEQLTSDNSKYLSDCPTRDFIVIAENSLHLSEKWAKSVPSSYNSAFLLRIQQMKCVFVKGAANTDKFPAVVLSATESLITNLLLCLVSSFSFAFS